MHSGHWAALDSSWFDVEVRASVEAAAQKMGMATGEFVSAALRGSSAAVMLQLTEDPDSIEALIRASHARFINEN